MESGTLLSQEYWNRALIKGQPRAAELLGSSETEQKWLGYYHTLRDINQQPWTWLRTCARIVASRDDLIRELPEIQSLALTGSSSVLLEEALLAPETQMSHHRRCSGHW